MTDKEKRELKDGVISIFKRFNILDHTATIGGLRDDILRYINSLQEEPASEGLEEAAFDYAESCKYEGGDKLLCVEHFKAGAEWGKNQAMAEIQVQCISFAHGCHKEDPVSKDFDSWYEKEWVPFGHSSYTTKDKLEESFKAGTEWQKKHLWKDAQGDDLPPIDREVIALLDNGKVVFAHRPYKGKYLGKNLTTGNIETLENQTFDEGGWNFPDVKYWLDCYLPKEIEL